MKARPVLLALLLLVGLVYAADFKKAKIIDVEDASLVGGNVIDEPAPNGVPTTASARVPAAQARFTLTIELEGKSYTALFSQDRHFQMTDLERGQSIPVRIEGKKLLLRRPSDGKEVKGKITHQEDVQANSQK